MHATPVVVPSSRPLTVPRADGRAPPAPPAAGPTPRSGTPIAVEHAARRRLEDRVRRLAALREALETRLALDEAAGFARPATTTVLGECTSELRRARALLAAPGPLRPGR